MSMADRLEARPTLRNDAWTVVSTQVVDFPLIQVEKFAGSETGVPRACRNVPEYAGCEMARGTRRGASRRPGTGKMPVLLYWEVRDPACGMGLRRDKVCRNMPLCSQNPLNR